MEFRVDYHMHPNLPRNDARAYKRAKRYWSVLQQLSINVIMVTEHVYKHPQRAYAVMNQTKPRNCFVFPGMEYLTKEGVDILLYAKDESLYTYPELKPKNLTCEELIAFANTHALVAIIAHPRILGTTSYINTKGYDAYTKDANKFAGVEIANEVFSGIPFASKLLQFLFPLQIKKMQQTMHLPRSDYPKHPQLLTAGSDAHHSWGLGTYVLIRTSKEKLYQTVLANKSPQVVGKQRTPFHLGHFIRESCTVFHEYLLKKRFS
ncbi:MAG: hypothetical protein H6502_00630 [Candidatus Woesearchaeota archaeon]|nr:MAG: hypothetical protein H6502_00630 [Candidatus Woesearchaeota archaeon]